MEGKTMVSSQGRVVIPVGIRRLLDIREGDTLKWMLEGDRVVVVKVEEHRSQDEILELLREGVKAEGVVEGATLENMKEVAYGGRGWLRERL